MDDIKICKETGELYYNYNTLGMTLTLLYLQAQEEGLDEEDIPWDHVVQLLSKLEDPPEA